VLKLIKVVIKMNFTIKDLIKQALIAAIYLVLVIIFWEFSFKEIQFRIAEILLILIFFDKKSIIGLTLGVIIANFFSPLLLFDLTFGVLASILSFFVLLLLKRWPYLALVFPALINGFIIGLGLAIIYELPYFITILTVFIGEFLVVYGLGLPLYYLLKRYHFEEVFNKL